MKILVLAGGSDQIALIKELKTRGHEIVLADYFQNPPAKSYADKHIVASTLDLARIENIAKEEKVSLICTACTDQALHTVAAVSEKLKLPCYISYDAALNVTNKAYMKKVLMSNKINTAKYAIINSSYRNSEFLKDFKFPLVVKPVDCNSSKGVKRVENKKELDIYLTDAIDLSRTHEAVVEEFIDGNEISADFYISDNKAIYLSATTSIKIPNKKSFTILGSIYPCIDEENKKKLTNIANQIANAFQIHEAPLLIQLIQKENDFYVIEFSARMGGGSKYRLIQEISSVNIMKKYCDLILGCTSNIVPVTNNNFIRMLYVYCNNGVIEKIIGLSELKANGIIEDFFIYKTNGMAINKSETSSDRACGYLVKASTQKELIQKIKQVDKQLKVIATDGKDLMKHDLLNCITVEY